MMRSCCFGLSSCNKHQQTRSFYMHINKLAHGEVKRPPNFPIKAIKLYSSWIRSRSKDCLTHKKHCLTYRSLSYCPVFLFLHYKAHYSVNPSESLVCFIDMRSMGFINPKCKPIRFIYKFVVILPFGSNDLLTVLTCRCSLWLRCNCWLRESWRKSSLTSWVIGPSCTQPVCP